MPVTETNPSTVVLTAPFDKFLDEFNKTVVLTVSLKDAHNALELTVGDLASLATNDKSSIVNAINEVFSNVASAQNLAGDVGNVASLNTNAKVVVDAINELYGDIGLPLTNAASANVSSVIDYINQVFTNVGSLASLATTDKTSIVNAINELVAEIGDTSSLTTTATNLVGAINEVNQKVAPATETTAGSIRLASQAEVDDGVVADEAVTPATLTNITYDSPASRKLGRIASFGSFPVGAGTSVPSNTTAEDGSVFIQMDAVGYVVYFKDGGVWKQKTESSSKQVFVTTGSDPSSTLGYDETIAYRTDYPYGLFIKRNGAWEPIRIVRVYDAFDFQGENGHISKNGVRLFHTTFASGTDADANIFIGRYSGNMTVGQGFTNAYEGTRNVAVGYGTLQNITLGYRNTFMGNWAGNKITVGYQNVGVGTNTLSSETTGVNNIAVGSYALGLQNGASHNIGIGTSAGGSLTTGSVNIAIGNYSLRNETTGTKNIAIGYGSLNSQSGANQNIAIGYASGYNLTSGSYNISIGSNALYSETTGTGNTAIGFSALQSQNGGNYNVAVGNYSSDALTTGHRNTAVGYGSLTKETTGAYNTALGYFALSNQNGASFNLGLGNYTGYELTTGSDNTFVGYNTGRGVTTGNNNTILGANVNLGNVSNNIALATGDGSVKAHFDSIKWFFKEDIWVTDSAGVSNIRLFTSNVSSFLRNDGTNTYILLTDVGNPYGGWNTRRPLVISNSNGDVRICNNGETCYINGNIAWHQGNVGARIAALPQKTTPVGDESVPLSSGEKLPVKELTKKKEFTAAALLKHADGDVYAFSLPIKFADGSAGIVCDLYGVYYASPINTNAANNRAYFNGSYYDTAATTTYYAIAEPAIPFPRRVYPSYVPTVGNYDAEYKKQFEDLLDYAKQNNMFDEVVFCANERNETQLVVYKSGIIVGGGYNWSYQFEDTSNGRYEKFVMPLNDYVAGGNLDLKDPNKRPVDIIVNYQPNGNGRWLVYATIYMIMPDGSILTRGGENINGVRGVGNNTNQLAGSAYVVKTDGTKLTNVVKFKVIERGAEGTCYAWDSSGNCYAWGYNNRGQVFDGTTTNALSATLCTEGPGQLTSKGVPDEVYVLGSGGYVLMLCHYKATKELYVMGNNVYGQLVDGTTTDRYVGAPNLITDVDEVFATEESEYGTSSRYHINRYGLSWGIGYNAHYQLGVGANLATNKNPRVVITGDINVGLVQFFKGENIGIETVVQYLGDMPTPQNVFDRGGYATYYSTTGTTTYPNGGSVWIGVELANPHPIKGAYTKPYWDANGYTSTAGGNVIIELYGSNTLPTSSTNGTLLGSVNMTGNPDPATADAWIPSNDTTTSYKYVWLRIINNSGGDAGFRLAHADFIPADVAVPVIKQAYHGAYYTHGTIAQSTSGKWWTWGYSDENCTLPVAQDIGYPGNPDDVAVPIYWPFEEPDEDVVDIFTDYRRGVALTNKGNVFMWGKTRANGSGLNTIPIRTGALYSLGPKKIDLSVYTDYDWS